MKKVAALLLSLFLLAGCYKKAEAIDKNGIYTTKEDVSLYLHTYHSLPKNFITKNEAKNWSTIVLICLAKTPISIGINFIPKSFK